MTATPEQLTAQDRRLEALRNDLELARAKLRTEVVDLCPSDDHDPRQHRDRLPPWCRACGRDDQGRRHHLPEPS